MRARACRMEEAHSTLFVSLPSLLDPSLAPPGKHVVHAFTPDWIENWQVRARVHAGGLVGDAERAAAAWDRCRAGECRENKEHATNSLQERSAATLHDSPTAPALQARSYSPTSAHTTRAHFVACRAQGLDVHTYEERKEAMADALIQRMDALWPGLAQSVSFREVRPPRAPLGRSLCFQLVARAVFPGTAAGSGQGARATGCHRGEKNSGGTAEETEQGLNADSFLHDAGAGLCR